MNNWSSRSGPDVNRRRSQRVMLSMLVTVSGKTFEGPFSEDAQTLVINAHGCLVGLKAKVAKGQTVQLKNAISPDPQECAVIWIGPTAQGVTQCGIEFKQPAPRFWGVSFPPTDWSPASAAAAMAESKKK